MTETCILLAVYNGETYLREQLNSLLNQDYSDFICYIHDDGSTDHSAEIIQEYSVEFPDKFRVIQAPSQGGAKNNFMFLMKAVDKTFQYIAFCDQDDIWLPDKLSLLTARIKQMERESPDQPCLVYSDMKVVDKDLNVISDSFIRYSNLFREHFSYNKLSIRNCAAGCSMLMNRQLIELAAVSDIQNISWHDWWCMLICSMVGKIENIPTALVLYRQHESNCLGAQRMTTSTKYKLRLEHLKNLKQYKEFSKEELRMKLRQLAALKQVSLVYQQYRNYIDVADRFETMSKKDKCRFILREHLYSSWLQGIWYCICC